MTEDEKMQVAVFRFSVISDFIHASSMSPEEEWAYEEKPDRLSYQLEEPVPDVLIAAVGKLKERNQPFVQPPLKPYEDNMTF